MLQSAICSRASARSCSRSSLERTGSAVHESARSADNRCASGIVAPPQVSLHPLREICPGRAGVYVVPFRERDLAEAAHINAEVLRSREDQKVASPVPGLLRGEIQGIFTSRTRGPGSDPPATPR